MTDSDVQCERELQKQSSQFTDQEAPQSESERPGCRLLLEPVLAGSMMAIFLATTSLQNLYLRTACFVDLGFDHAVCESGVGEAFREAEVESQKLVSHINVSRGFVGAFISCLVLLFLGPWSDCSRRRKPLIVISLLGMCVCTLNVLIIITFPRMFSSISVLYLVQIPMSLGGNFGLLLAASYSYIGDVCHHSGRNVTMAMGSHRACVQVASVLGSLAGPVLYHHLGFYGVFPVVFLLQFGSLAFAVVFVQDVNANLQNRVRVLDVRLPLAAMRCLCARRHGHRSAVVWLMVVVALVEKAIMAAEQVLMYMYVRNKYHWDDIWFGYYLAYRSVLSFGGTIMILQVLKTRLKLSDELVGVLSGLSLLAAETLLIITWSTSLVFVVPIVAILAQGGQVVQRPILNKQIRPDEQGKIYSIVSALEQACQMAASPAFNHLYASTVDTMPDAWLIPCITLACVHIVSFTFAHSLHNRAEKPKSADALDRENHKIEDMKNAVSRIDKQEEIGALLLSDDKKIAEKMVDDCKYTKSTANLNSELKKELIRVTDKVDEFVCIHIVETVNKVKS